MDENSTYWTYQFFGQALCAMGSEAGNIIASIYIANVVDVVEVAVAGSTLQFAVMLANVCAPSLSTLVYTRLVIAKNGSLLSQEESKKNGRLLTSLRASFWFWAALGFLAALLTVLFLRSLGKVGKRTSEEKSGEAVRDIAQGTADSSSSRRDITDKEKKGAEEATLHQGEKKAKRNIS
ncbi:hypothetical protein QFC20_000797 [Naganishia adeliensis]|uniref:Uncharacterized protein n=1 Tax=Naganishia adeliensis TaxID=92952 RepID=A0ACC2WXT7_9TREE|nr:hypothetical protein QFC20_000797 [Naganishia adeliensis]